MYEMVEEFSFATPDILQRADSTRIELRGRLTELCPLDLVTYICIPKIFV